eukprot:3109736-Rhodomonas_salina.1
MSGPGRQRLGISGQPEHALVNLRSSTTACGQHDVSQRAARSMSRSQRANTCHNNVTATPRYDTIT